MTSTNKEILESVEKYGKMAIGKKEYVAHLQGKRITFKGAVLARCYECNGYYADGKEDCDVPTCPIYPYMPYNPNKQKQSSSLSPKNMGVEGVKIDETDMARVSARGE